MSVTAMPERGYRPFPVSAHWVSAAAVFALLGIGAVMVELPSGDAWRFALFQMHKSLGITALLLVVARLAWRWRRPPPPPAPGPNWQRLAARLNHWALYALVVSAPLAGWALISSTPASARAPTQLYGVLPWPYLPLSENWRELAGEVHAWLVWTLAALVAVHVLAALHHRFIVRDDVLGRVLAHGRHSALAVAVLVAAVLAYAWTLAAPLRSASALPALPAAVDVGIAAPVTAGPHWHADADRGTLRFVGEVSQERFEGRFQRFDARMQLEGPGAFVEAVVQTASLDSDDADRDGTMRGEDWFDVARWPQAVFRADAVRALGEGRYRADGQLRIRDATRPASVALRWRRQGEEALVEGQAAIKRRDFGLGQGVWADETWVSDAVAVDFSLRMAPAP